MSSAGDPATNGRQDQIAPAGIDSHASVSAAHAPAKDRAAVTIPLTGMSCAACARTIERTLQALPGVEAAGVNYATERATVRFDPESVGLEALVRAVRDVGYDVLPVGGGGQPGAAAEPDEQALHDAQENAREEEYRQLRRKFVVAIVLSAPIFVISMAHVTFPGINWAQLTWPFRSCSMRVLSSIGGHGRVSSTEAPT
jgi:Cu+-exporting ATPase